MKDKIGLILLAGGVGRRTQRKVPKQLLLVGGKPMLVHSLEKIEDIPQIASVVIPCADEAIEKTRYVLDAWGYDGAKYRIVEGGATRHESVSRGLSSLSGCDYVIIHEAARPFAAKADFLRLVEIEDRNATLGVPIPFTVAEVDKTGNLSGALDRSALVNVQLPQIFEYATLAAAHEKAAQAGRQYTEDASLLHDQLGVAVRIVEGSATNIKITYPSDLVIAESIYRSFVIGGADD
ncbi:2-C-methyl-D-erythritol 4-phosphate cytidylyltransferase [Gordonibacter urolithinfaciens]|jgi:2-C-methyl-D-erythritol 4-phosphate cytidylyltransferase|uniref:2-C-methyl-D-erythritol 4-phosphate cytidylyltransferase n=1 Tax=Gordonibacter urolithinfaciens TaxID=1335613 RepID=A0A7K0I888_9ACTN|nr:2-C-methyl-D-erythritol 4-phosphate cytidylyltransferase [Gordonibacter urolithinfaciens]MCB6561824.1 2-C-methyl-D-erythritol 4-phosphate cytidylyltransferase [Gordonibacter urolithinfaciens]MCB7085882.1 2-C-methyl-D-erythritol 4-phosphate cytidylyltransferase [Gordonibacter urolithinfaciens]MSA93730.1 2-C-methyl-D-erythritol 4-phosphate cytidylyltransferase [Gordonibacter urolithinfaciens]